MTPNTGTSSSRTQRNRRQTVTQPGTTTSRRSRRTHVQPIPIINFDEAEVPTVPRVFDKYSGISTGLIRNLLTPSNQINSFSLKLSHFMIGLYNIFCLL